MTAETPEQALLEHLGQRAPRRLLLVADDCPPALRQWSEEHDCQLLLCAPGADPAQPTGGQRVDMAVALAPTTAETRRLLDSHQLGLLKNLYTETLWLLVQEQQEAPQDTLLGLGFRRLQRFADTALSSYGYNLISYNRQRSWNTPQYWANPENWGKYRW